MDKLSTDQFVRDDLMNDWNNQYLFYLQMTFCILLKKGDLHIHL